MTDRFSHDDETFLLDGAPFRVVSGALHYFRVHPDQWADRIEMGRLMGLNTIETYIPWNAHSKTRGAFDTTGGLDLGRFLDLVSKAGLHAIVRPGPYICAEWDGGGLPAWLLTDPAVRPRSSEPRYFEAVTEYLEAALAVVVPRQIDAGGPVILMQVENEYGAYGDDADYLRALTEVYRRNGVTVPLTTVDQPRDGMLSRGNIPGLLATGSFGSRVGERLSALREHQPAGPLMCSEFWCGWFDHWGGFHHVTDAEESARSLDSLLGAGASVNIYMLHGGTNFGLTNGANDKGVYQPTVTSYDYDAPLDEAGRPTAKFWRFREVISRYEPVPDLPKDVHGKSDFVVPDPSPLHGVGSLDEFAPTEWIAVDGIPTMDDLGIATGFLRYRVPLLGGPEPAMLEFAEVRDRAWISLDGVAVGVLSRAAGDRSIALPHGRGLLEVLVEDEGRVNYGPRIGEPKGLIGPATLGGEEVRGWQVATVPLDALPDTAAGLESTPLPLHAGIIRAEFDVDAPTDLALDTSDLGWGIAWMNGFALGRFRPRGPQRTLYVPAPATRAGRNTVVLFTQEPPRSGLLTFRPSLDLGPVDD
ncbi:beta-galactosidase [Microbacterium foliorum]|uniref:Beta-galactosidase n=1 Tax=Microbacterium foliorum TaxID=104336 RepID=A0ABU1HVE0_9MICO|nr:beta-galactosidase [Microbacterium foliorum]MDR6144018.1 beta-galactosidase [Microbacterium foliorum]